MESRLRHLLSADGIKECPVLYEGAPIGRADAATVECIIEIKEISQWKHALGQVLTYSFCTGKKPKLVLLGTERKLIVDVCKHHHVQVQFIDPAEVKRLTDNWLYDLTCDHLKALCKKKGVKIGNKGEMVSRLKVGLDELTCDMLRRICKVRKLSTTGKKEELVGRLR